MEWPSLSIHQSNNLPAIESIAIAHSPFRIDEVLLLSKAKQLLHLGIGRLFISPNL